MTRTQQKPWLADRIENSRRKAQPRTCPRCDADILVGPDDDRHSTTARVNPAPVDALTEAAALLTGRYSCDLIHGALHHRAPHHTQNPNRPHPVHLQHTCPETTP